MEEEKIELLIVSYLSAQISSEEQKALLEWIAESEEHQQEFERIKAIWTAGKYPASARETADALKRTKAKMGIVEEEVAYADRVRPLMRWLRAASAILVLGVAGYLYYGQANKEVYLTKTTAGHIDSVYLTDGSKIFLSANSELSYPEEIKGKTRQVSLIRGEAFFKIAKDPSRPFTVQINRSKVTVLGTSFNIRNISESVKLSVNTGKVSFESLPGEEKLILLAGMGVNFNAEARTVTRFSTLNQNNTFWMNKELKFINASLTEVFESLENCYGVDFIVKDSIRSLHKFNAEFKDNSLEDVIEVLKETYPINLKPKNQQIIVTNK